MIASQDTLVGQADIIGRICIPTIVVKSFSFIIVIRARK
jgi:hypothetical protein